MIFTSNDVIINLGVITAGLLVNWLNSNKPDLIIGTIVFVLVIQGAIRKTSGENFTCPLLFPLFFNSLTMGTRILLLKYPAFQ
jgi:hypothetical protein